MKVKELEVGTVFNISNTPSYPKLKTKDGYVDIRDSIVNESGNCDEDDAVIMSLDLMAKMYEATIQEIKDWIYKQTKIYMP